MCLDRPLIVGSCIAALSLVGGCYRAAEKSETKASGSGSKSEIVESKPFESVSVASIIEEANRKAKLMGPTPEGKPSATPTGTNSAIANPTPSVSTPIASATVVASPSASPSATFDPYVRPAMQRAVPTASADVRASRSPIRPTKPGVPPPRTRALAAPDVKGDALGITFDSLMFEMKPTDYFSPTMLTDSVRALFDKKVKIRGYIHPASMLVEKGAKRFVLVRDDQGCCFGPGALLYDNIIVDMVPGKSTNFSVRPIAVEGVLTYREYRDLGDRPTSIFHLEAESVE